MPKRLSQLFAFKKNVVSKAIRYMFMSTSQLPRSEIYAETVYDKWKQTPYPIWFLRRCDSKSSKVSEPLPKRNKNTGQVPRRTGVSLQFCVKPSTPVYHRNFT